MSGWYSCDSCGTQVKEYVDGNSHGLYERVTIPEGQKLMLHSCPPLNLDDLERALYRATCNGPVEYAIAHVRRGELRDAPGIGILDFGPTSKAEREGTPIPQSVLDVMRRAKGAVKANREPLNQGTVTGTGLRESPNAIDPRALELIKRITSTPGPVASALSASEWHELRYCLVEPEPEPEPEPEQPAVAWLAAVADDARHLEVVSAEQGRVIVRDLKTGKAHKFLVVAAPAYDDKTKAR